MCEQDTSQTHFKWIKNLNLPIHWNAVEHNLLFVKPKLLFLFLTASLFLFWYLASNADKIPHKCNSHRLYHRIKALVTKKALPTSWSKLGNCAHLDWAPRFSALKGSISVKAIPGYFVSSLPCRLLCPVLPESHSLPVKHWRAQSFPWWKLLAQGVLAKQGESGTCSQERLEGVFSCSRTEST